MVGICIALNQPAHVPHAGDTAEVMAPSGKHEVEIIDIKYV